MKKTLAVIGACFVVCEVGIAIKIYGACSYLAGLHDGKILKEHELNKKNEEESI